MIYAQPKPGIAWQNKKMDEIYAQLQARIQEWRHHLHRHPETALGVEKTAAYRVAGVERQPGA